MLLHHRKRSLALVGFFLLTSSVNGQWIVLFCSGYHLPHHDNSPFSSSSPFLERRSSRHHHTLFSAVSWSGVTAASSSSTETPTSHNHHQQQQQQQEHPQLSSTLFESSLSSSLSSRRFWMIQQLSSFLRAVVAATVMAPSRAAAATDQAATLLLQRDCANGALAPEQAVPGAYENACMYLPVRPIPVYHHRDSKGYRRYPGSVAPTVVLQIQQQPAVAGATGMAVWNSSLLLTRLLEALGSESSSSSSSAAEFWKKHPTVVELGCGTGVASLAAAALGATHVIATDGNPNVVQLAQANIAANREAIATAAAAAATGKETTRQPSTSSSTSSTSAAVTVPPPPPRRIETKLLPWGLMDALDLSDFASLVIGSDLTYNPAGWPLLAESMSTILAAEPPPSSSSTTTPTTTTTPLVLYLSLGHAGFNVNGEVDGFLSVAASRGLEPVPPSDPDYPFAVPPPQWLAETCRSAEERAVLNSGVRVVVLRRRRRPTTRR